MSPTLFRKKPVTVSAMQWTGTNEGELIAFTGNQFYEIYPEDRGPDPDKTAAVFDVLHRTWVGMETGQWVIKGVRGEFYPIDESVLADTYDRVPAAEPDEAA